jgi:hypothetical protein
MSEQAQASDSAGSVPEPVKRRYRVQWRTYAWAYTTVEAEDEEDAIEQSFRNGYPTICAQCSGWGQEHSLELGEVWDEPQAELADD